MRIAICSRVRYVLPYFSLLRIHNGRSARIETAQQVWEEGGGMHIVPNETVPSIGG